MTVSKRGCRQKGFSFEREVVHMAWAKGCTSERSWGSNGQTRGLRPETDVTIDRMQIQCKRMKKVPALLRGIGDSLYLVLREDHGDPLITLPLDVFLTLYREAQCPSQNTAQEKSSSSLPAATSSLSLP
jgi:hypothetical protein